LIATPSLFLQVFTSAALNLESGAFVALMQTTAMDETANSGIEVALPLSPRIVALKPLVMAYFLAAVVFDAFKFFSERLGIPVAVCLLLTMITWMLGLASKAAIEVQKKEDPVNTCMH
jgi:hypothetical protein